MSGPGSALTAGVLAAQGIGTAASVQEGDVAAAVPRAIEELEH